MQKFAYLIISALAFAGCSSGYEQFYVDESARVRDWILPDSNPQAPTVFTSSGDFDADERKMFEDGYVRIGYVSFNGPSEGNEKIIEQAKQVGAALVIASSSYTNSITSSIPITTTKPVTTYNSGNVRAYGSGGSAYGTYSGTSTSYVPTTTYIPTTVNRYDQSAIFFAKMKPACMGYLSGEISNEERQKVGTNSGVKIAAVRKGSPVYEADVVPGDIILEFDGRKITPADTPKLSSRQKVDLTIFRSGVVIHKAVTTDQCS